MKIRKTSRQMPESFLCTVRSEHQSRLQGIQIRSVHAKCICIPVNDARRLDFSRTRLWGRVVSSIGLRLRVVKHVGCNTTLISGESPSCRLLNCSGW
jgi:hypothetical protein